VKSQPKQFKATITTKPKLDGIAMKPLFELICVCVVSVGVTYADGATLLTFDDLSPSSDHIIIPNGYGSLQWNNFSVLNGLNRPSNEGYWTGTVSPSNVAFNSFGDPAFIRSSSSFDLNSAYLTAAFADGMRIQVQGFVGTTLAYDNTYTVNTNAPTLINFNYLGVDLVRFISSPSSQFVADNLMVTIPEPTTFGLLSMGTVLGALGALRKNVNRRDRA
jgi:hypothetical protein